MAEGALSHIRVLDLSRVMAAPWCTQILADLGADVIKIERPGEGDDTRGWGPPFLPGGRDAGYFLACNRGKRSVTVDMAAPEGQAIIRRLAESSDVCVENFKVGALARYGLDAASLRAINPRLVYCSVTGFGQSGPRAGRQCRRTFGHDRRAWNYFPTRRSSSKLASSSPSGWSSSTSSSVR